MATSGANPVSYQNVTFSQGLSVQNNDNTSVPRNAEARLSETDAARYQCRESDNIHFSEFNDLKLSDFAPNPENVLVKRNIPLRPEPDPDSTITGLEQHYGGTYEVAIAYSEKREGFISVQRVISDIRDASVYRSQLAGAKKSHLEADAVYKDTFSILRILTRDFGKDISPLDVCAVFYCLSPDKFSEDNIAALINAVFPDFTLNGKTTVSGLYSAVTDYPLAEVLNHVDQSNGIVRITRLFSAIEPQLVILSAAYNPRLYTQSLTRLWLSDIKVYDGSYMKDYSAAANILSAALNMSDNSRDDPGKIEFILNFVTEAVNVIFLSCDGRIPDSLNEANSVNVNRFSASANKRTAYRSRVITVARRVSETYNDAIASGELSNTDPNRLCYAALICDGCQKAIILINFDCHQVCVNENFNDFFLVNFPDDDRDYCAACFKKLKAQLTVSPPQVRAHQGAAANRGATPPAVQTEQRRPEPPAAAVNRPEPVFIVNEPYFIPDNR